MFDSFEPECDFPQQHVDKLGRTRTKTSVRAPSVTYLSLPFHGGVTNPTMKARWLRAFVPDSAQILLINRVSPQFARPDGQDQFSRCIVLVSAGGRCSW